MADERGYWGLEIGQAGLKAIRLVFGDVQGRVTATAFDYVRHEKLLSQPDAIAEEMIPEAIETFLERNDVSGDIVALGVSGQNALARFIQLPPVEANKVGQIVQYEAKQQIPFALEDVVWDYQTIGGGADEDTGFMLDAEVGLFAMKRDLVDKALQPFISRKIEVELVQIGPLACFNYLCYDLLGIRPGTEAPEEGDHYIVCDIGAEATTLIVTDGSSIWIRNVPIGGTHFSRALVKGMKLTFAKAEHLKCNATRSPDPKAVFQTLRPVFNDFLAELQRSIGYFSSVNRDAKIAKLIGVGNGFKLPGLPKFLEQALGYPVERIEAFDALDGDQTLADELFLENIPTFVVPYGTALQAMGQATMKTSLLPKEIVVARLIRRKKPWAVLACSLLLAAFSLSAFGYGLLMQSVSAARWQSTEQTVAEFNQEAAAKKAAYGEQEARIDDLKNRGERLLGSVETRVYWPELFRAINAAMPDDENIADPNVIETLDRVRIKSVTTTKVPSFEGWFLAVPQVSKDLMLESEREAAPEGEGYIVTLVGEHFHDTRAKTKDPAEKADRHGAGYVALKVVKPLQEWELTRELDTDGDDIPEDVAVPIRKIGISHVAFLTRTLDDVEHPAEIIKQRREEAENFEGSGGAFDAFDPTRTFDPAGGFGRGGARGTPRGGITRGSARARRGAETQAEEELVRPTEHTRFLIEFAWIPTPPEERADADPLLAVEATEGDGTTEDGLTDETLQDPDPA
ncbi:MAG: type IV pilus assembly protein PilM [Planctomycetota bacterium]